MKRIAPICALICLLMLFASFSFAAENNSRTFAPVQDGFVTEAQVVPTFAPDRILVKFTPEGLSNAIIREVALNNAGGDAAWTGLVSLDAVLNGLDVSRISRMHGDLKNKAAAEKLGTHRWYLIEVPIGTDIEVGVASLAADPNVEFAEPDLYAFPAVTPNDPLHQDNWGHNNTAQLPGFDWGGTWSHTGPPVGTVGFDTKAQSAWGGSQGYGSTSVVIAILDSGVDATHPDLLQVPGYDYGDGNADPDDDSADPGHGTACAGVAAAIANNSLGAVGVAGGVSIMPLKVSTSAGSLTFTAITNAIYHAADNGADVISMSFGAATDSYAPTDAAIQYAYDAGVTLFAATGNENFTTISYPAVNTNVISVGAASPCGDRKRSSSDAAEVNSGVSTDPNGYTCDGERWWGSNYGHTTQDSRFAVDIIAPTILPTTDIQGSGGYAPGDYSDFFNGTSCSTPYAAGVAALIKSLHPTWGPAQVRAQMVDTAIDIVNVESGAGWDRYTGYGMVDAAAAVGAVVVLPPTADFEAVPTDGCAPMTVDFTDLSTGDVTGWNWTFGNGQSSTQQNPTIIYADPGQYDVTLIATGPEGTDSRTRLNYVTVGVAPVTDFVSSTPTGPAPLTVNFADVSANTTGRVWDFGDATSDTAQYPSHTYTNPGTYTVMMIATGGCAPDTLTKVDYVVATSSTPPVAAFSGTPTSGCGPLEVVFTDESTGDVTSWNWDFGDGQADTLQNPTHTYLSSGDFDVRLIATGPAGIDTLTVAGYISVTEGVTAGFSVSDTTGVAPLAVDFTDLSTGSPTSWFWDFGDAATATEQNPSHIYTTGGTYSVMLIATGECGPDTLVQTDRIVVSAPDAPVAAFSGTPLNGCPPLETVFTDETTGDVTSWDWDFGDGQTDTLQNPAHTYLASGDFDVRLIATGPGGADTLTVTGYVSVTEGVTADFSVSDTTGVAPLAVDFTDLSTGSPTSWFWDFGDAATATEQNPSHIYTTGGTYSVMLIATGECGPDTLVQTDRIVVSAPDAPVAAFSGTPLNGCAPLETVFTDETTGDITSWDWDFGDGQADTLQNPTHTYLASGDFDVRLIATGPGGVDTLTVAGYISVTEGVTAGFSVSDTTGTVPVAIDFTDLSTGSPTSWFWDFGDGSSDMVQNPGHTYTVAGTYSVMLIATGECGPDTLVQADMIVVSAPDAPVAAFSGTPLSGCAPLEVVFTDESVGGIITWAWDFGDGGTDTIPNPSHTFVTSGLFTVSLTVTGPGGSNTKVMEDYVDVEDPVTAAFALSDNSGTAPLEIDFTDQSSGAPTFWRWDFGDATSDTVQHPTHTYTTVDTFTVTLITGNSCSRDTLVMVDAIRILGLSAVAEVAPSRYSLEQNVPNPFNPMTTIYFELPEAANVRLQVFDISGRLVRNLLNGASLGAGRQDVVWNGKDDSGQQVAAGVYFYSMSTGSFNETKRMVLVK